mgnify:FL=1
MVFAVPRGCLPYVYHIHTQIRMHVIWLFTPCARIRVIDCVFFTWKGGVVKHGHFVFQVSITFVYVLTLRYIIEQSKYIARESYQSFFLHVPKKI